LGEGNPKGKKEEDYPALLFILGRKDFKDWLEGRTYFITYFLPGFPREGNLIGVGQFF